MELCAKAHNAQSYFRPKILHNVASKVLAAMAIRSLVVACLFAAGAYAATAPEDQLAKEMTHDLEVYGCTRAVGQGSINTRNNI